MKIVQKGNDVLRKIAREVSDFKNPKLKKEIEEMHEALSGELDGVALAAPQIGISKRIFVISPKAYKELGDKPLVFINPKITKRSRKKEWLPEGCLSVRPWYGKTYRHLKVTVEAWDENGKKFSYGGSDLIAQIFQHEIDHLDGILFSDHAKDLRKLAEEEQFNYKRESR